VSVANAFLPFQQFFLVVQKSYPQGRVRTRVFVKYMLVKCYGVENACNSLILIFFMGGGVRKVTIRRPQSHDKVSAKSR
jgi:hypothetical protein